MAKQNDALKDSLRRSREIDISVIGRKSGRIVSNPVWFVFEEAQLYLLPVRGSDTQWFKNVVENPKMRIDAKGVGAEITATVLTDTKQVSAVVEKFLDKYGAGDVKKYYSKLDAAIVAQMQ